MHSICGQFSDYFAFKVIVFTMFAFNKKGKSMSFLGVCVSEYESVVYVWFVA